MKRTALEELQRYPREEELLLHKLRVGELDFQDAKDCASLGHSAYLKLFPNQKRISTYWVIKNRNSKQFTIELALFCASRALPFWKDYRPHNKNLDDVIELLNRWLCDDLNDIAHQAYRKGWEVLDLANGIRREAGPWQAADAAYCIMYCCQAIYSRSNRIKPNDLATNVYHALQRLSGLNGKTPEDILIEYILLPEGSSLEPSSQDIL